jgi:hypothetical protein
VQADPSDEVVFAIAHEPKQNHIITGGRKGTLRVFDPTTTQQLAR